MFQTKFVEKNQNTHFVFYNLFFPPHENRAFYEIMLENIVQPDRPQMTIRRMPIARWIPKATDIDSEYVILFSFSTATLVTRTRLIVTL